MKKARCRAAAVLFLCMLILKTASAAEHRAELETKIRSGNDSLSRQRETGDSLDRIIAGIRKIRLQLPVSQSREDLKKLILEGLDPAAVKKLLADISTTTALLKKEAAPDGAAETAAAVEKAVAKASASIAGLDSAARMTDKEIVEKERAGKPSIVTVTLAAPQKPPEGVIEASPEEIGRMIADGRAIKAADLAAGPKQDDRFLLTLQIPWVREAAERALEDLQLLRLSLASLDRTVEDRLEPLRNELKMLTSRPSGESAKDGDK